MNGLPLQDTGVPAARKITLGRSPQSVNVDFFWAIISAHIFANVREQMDCARCLRTHGPGCAASYTDEEGEPLCVFCLDQVVCPIARRIAAIPRAKRSRWIVNQRIGDQIKERKKNLAKEERMMTTTTATVTDTKSSARAPETSTVPRICSEPGCKATLRPANSTGKCQLHRSHSKANGAAQLTVVPRRSRAAAATSMQIRVCKVPGCGRELVWNNKTGNCKDHQETHGQAHFKTNGHGNGTAVDRANGLSPVAPGEPSRAPAANGNGHESAVEARVNLVLAGIPLEDKVALITGWLRGRECA
jgi:hypothetical protein